MVENSHLKNSQSGMKIVAFKGIQNGVVERKNGTIMGLWRRILKEKSLPLQL